MADVGVLQRVALGADGRLALGRQAPGRGAWLHLVGPECLDLALKRGGFRRAWATQPSSDDFDRAIAALRALIPAADRPDASSAPAPAP